MPYWRLIVVACILCIAQPSASLAQTLVLESKLWIGYNLPASVDLAGEALNLESNCLNRRTIADQQCYKAGCEGENEVAFRRCIGRIQGVTFHVFVCADASCDSSEEIDKVDLDLATDPELNSVFNHIQPGRVAFTGTSLSLRGEGCTAATERKRLPDRLASPICRGFGVYAENRLIASIRRGNKAAVQVFTDRGFSLGYDGGFLPSGSFPRGQVDFSPLRVAAETGNVEMMRFLASLGAKVNVHEQGLSTPLWTAVANGHADAVRFLLDRGADLNLLQPLSATVKKRQMAIARILIEHGAVMDSVDVRSNYNARSPLEEAVWSEDLEMVNFFFSVGARANVQVLDGGRPVTDPRLSSVPVIARPLCYAAQRGNLELVQLLLQKGADPNGSAGKDATRNSIHNRFGYPLVCAALSAEDGKNPQAYDAIMRLLLRRTNLLHPMNYANPMLYALDACLPSLLPIALENGFPVNRKDEFGQTALMKAHACSEGTEFLIAHGADVNATTMEGWTALHFSAACGDYCLATSGVLLGHGARTSIRSTQNSKGSPEYPLGSTALDVARTRGASDTVKLLTSGTR